MELGTNIVFFITFVRNTFILKFYKHFYWVYLLLAILFIHNGYIDIVEEEGKGSYVSFFLALLAVFMFFFRRNFVKKMQDRANKNK